jgi:hypothetical protein
MKRAGRHPRGAVARSSDEDRWLLLIHQIPPKPDYLRVKIWRRLQRVGAVPVKNSVYVLPQNERSQEDFEWIVREIVAQGGDASVCAARFINGLSDEHIEAMFHAARDADYAQAAEAARRLCDELRKAGEARRREIAAEAERLRRRLAEIIEIDLLSAPGRLPAETAFANLEERLRPLEATERAMAASYRHEDYQGRTWVTRKGIHVDRMASAWLIRRFIDGEASFKFVPPKGYRPQPREVRFDMFEAEFTHEGGACTFEVLLERFGLGRDVGLVPIAEIVHELDVHDEKFARDELPGIAALITGIALTYRSDEERLERASNALDALYQYYRRRKER